MGTICQGSACGGPSEEQIKQFNKNGIYMPKQINEQVENDWVIINKKGNETVTKSELQKICNQSVVGLGKLGGKDKFNKKEFNKVLDEFYKNQTEFEKKDSIKALSFIRRGLFILC